MRRVGLICLVALHGCNQQPSFDERYSEADKAIREKAAAIDAELAGPETAGGGDSESLNSEK